jgi:hypothetical protein
MKPAKIFRQYIWIINTLKAYRRLSFEQLCAKWISDDVAEGNPLQRSSFNRHRDAILDMFGIIIDCEPRTYKYYISNPEVLSDDSIGRWLFSTLAVHGVLADSAAVKERLVLESVPTGEQYLDIIIRAIRSDRRLRLGYQKFNAEGYVKTDGTPLSDHVPVVVRFGLGLYEEVDNHVQTDIVGDDGWDMADLSALVNILVGKTDSSYNMDAADVNGDGSITLADLTELVNIMP